MFLPTAGNPRAVCQARFGLFLPGMPDKNKKQV